MRRLFALGFGLVLGACQAKEEHAPAAGPCTTDCQNPPVGSVPIGSGQSQSGFGGAGNSNNPGAGNSSTAGVGTLDGTVAQWFDDSFTSTQPYVEPAQVRGQDAGGNVITANWNGSTAFELNGVQLSQTTWLSVLPSDPGVLETLHAIGSVAPSSLQLELVQADVYDAMLEAFATGVVRRSDRAQVVLWFRSNMGTGVAGVTVDSSSAEVIGYRDTGVWSPTATATDSSGLAVLVNLSSSAFPGTTARIQLDGMATGYVDVRTASGAVSVVSAVVQP